MYEGEFVTLLGPSGSGKTTLLKMVAGFIKADSGTLLLDRRNAASLEPRQRDIGMVFQDYALFPHMNVYENVRYGLRFRKLSRDTVRDRVEEMLSLVGLSDYRDRKPNQLSGGQMQRVALARALAIQPRILLMDEPLGALDREMRIRMAEELRRMHERVGVAVLHVTHDQEEALIVADRIGVMHQGGLVAMDEPREIFRNPKSVFAARFLSRANIVDAAVLQVYDSVSAAIGWQGLSFHIDCSPGQPTGDCRLAVPPWAFKIVPAGNPNAFAVRVREMTFLGEVTQFLCETADGVELLVRLSTAEVHEASLSALYLSLVEGLVSIVK
ncbi:MAG: hypothetical protein BGO26_14640 [Actinobacteria bacterium 69-20]|nr:MAG: hypothetical protein BGO26_14640 [Actinobacteria bacterium 69-20]